MCYSCWMEYGSPVMLPERVLAAVTFIAQVYDQPGGGCGGGLHIVVDDWNLEDKHIQRHLDRGLTGIERLCAEQLMALPLEERAAALGRYDGYF